MKVKNSRCQRQAADDDPGGHGDRRSPDATARKAGASLRFAEGQYFPCLIGLLPPCGERVILSRGERAFEGHDVVLPSARTWPGSSGLGSVPPWLEACPVTTRASPQDEPRDDPRDYTDGRPEQRKRKSRWLNATGCPKGLFTR